MQLNDDYKLPTIFYHTLYGHIITLGHINFHFSDSDSSPHRAKKSSSSRKGREEPERRVVRRASPSPPRRVPSKNDVIQAIQILQNKKPLLQKETRKEHERILATKILPKLRYF